MPHSTGVVTKPWSGVQLACNQARLRPVDDGSRVQINTQVTGE
jgi:hypothetical protein